MKKTLLSILILICFQYSVFSQKEKQNYPKPHYYGVIDYTKGGFGGFNYPEKGDSVYVFLKDSGITVVVFPFKEKISNARDLNTIVMSDLKLNKKKVYDEIITPTKTKHTNSFDMKFLTQHGGSDGITYGVVSITHFGKGEIADLNLIVEKEELRIYDMFVAKLNKLQ